MKKNINQNKTIKKNYEQEKKWCEEFLEKFQDDSMSDPNFGNKKYLIQLQKVLNGEKDFFEIYFEDLEEYFNSDIHQEFLHSIKHNTYRYIKMFNNATDYIKINSTVENNVKEMLENDFLSYNLQMSEKRSFNEGSSFNQSLIQSDQIKQNSLDPAQIKKLIKRKFTLIIVPGPNSKQNVSLLRNLNSSHVGSFITVHSTVVKASETKSVLEIACYYCEVCKEDIFKVISGKYFMPPVICNSEKCLKNNTRGTLIQNFAMSKFTSMQEIKIQETSNQTPPGAIPRTFTVFLKSNNVRKCSPGDTITLHGILLTRSIDNFRFSRDDFLHETYIEGLKIIKEKRRLDVSELNSEIKNNIFQISCQENYKDLLINSIAPEIFGMGFVKEAILYQMVGGSIIKKEDGLKIRGDINLALIGDPGLAKSQLLKYVSYITPRSVYTTGKGSSGAGLTATISRDKITGEITLEGGALVLSDLGICCIDEFDKMEESDRTSIHEVMEQQTISLAKAGITCSLNARTSILAAANPIWGKYNSTKTPHENIGMTHSLLSRFDLIFVLIDNFNKEQDQKMAKHIMKVHSSSSSNNINEKTLSASTLRHYITLAQSINPVIPESLHSYIINEYIQKRKDSEKKGKFGQYITPRSLLSAIRFSQASAKLRFSSEVELVDIEAAMRLISEAMSSIYEEENEETRLARRINTNSKDRIPMILKEIFKNEKANIIPLDLIIRKMNNFGIITDTFNKVLKSLIASDLYMIDENNQFLKLIN